mgnify:CR=1 FL=1
MEPNKVSADEALEKLIEGNKRFVNGELKHPHMDDVRRNMLKDGQAPFAIIVACADSRVLPDIIFDQGLGDLFVIRVAGNVAKDKVLGSIEYAIEHLGTKLVFVLGHESCGAVTAALEPATHEGHINKILDLIRPAVHMARHQDGNLLENAIKNNAIMVKENITDSLPVINRAVKEKGVKVVAGYYSLADGSVVMLD